MARFYASIHGDRGDATRTGTVRSGISGHIRGWNLGAITEISVNTVGNDVATVYLTDGSNGSRKLIKLWSGTRADLDDLVYEQRSR